jgi:hypothetical protein
MHARMYAYMYCVRVYICMHTYTHFISCILVLVLYLAFMLLRQHVNKNDYITKSLQIYDLKFFPIICICFYLTKLPVTQVYGCTTSSHQIAEHETHVEVVWFKLLSQHLPGKTRQNNENTQSVWSAKMRISNLADTRQNRSCFSQTCWVINPLPETHWLKGNNPSVGRH